MHLNCSQVVAQSCMEVFSSEETSESAEIISGFDVQKLFHVATTTTT